MILWKQEKREWIPCKQGIITRLIIPTTNINIDKSVNVDFMADKLNSAKSYVDITDCWYVHYKCARTFQSSLSRYDGVNRQREPYCCHCSSYVWNRKSSYIWVTKPIKHLAGLEWFVCHMLLTLLGQELTKILFKNIKS